MSIGSAQNTPGTTSLTQGTTAPTRLKGRQAARVRTTKAEGALVGTLLVIVLILVGLPVGALLWGSFRTRSPVFPNSEYTLGNWVEVYTSSGIWGALLNTIGLAIPVTIISVVMGALFAWLLVATDVPWRSRLQTLIIMPFFLSPFVGAMAWVSLASPRTGWINLLLGRAVFDIYSLSGVIFVMSLYYVPYAYMFTVGAIRSLDASLEEASRMCGGNLWKTFRQVTLPLVWPSLVAAATLIFVLAGSMFSIPGLLGPHFGFTNIPYEIYYSTRSWPPQWPLASTMGTLLLWITVLGVYWNQRLAGQGRKYVTVSGKGHRPAFVRLGRWRWAGFGACVLYILLALVLPYTSLILSSFMKYSSTNLSGDIWTLEHYKILGDATFLRATMNTFILGLTVPTGVALLSIAIGYAVQRTSVRGRKLLDFIASVPIAVPGIVFGIGLLWAYFRIPLPIYGTLYILALAYAAMQLPHGVRVVSSTLIRIDKELEEASRTSGAGIFRTVKNIVMPLLRSSVAYVWILTFILVAREFSAAIVLYGPGSMVLSVLVWDLMEAGGVQAAYALGVVQTALLLLCTTIALYGFRAQIVERV